MKKEDIQVKDAVTVGQCPDKCSGCDKMCNTNKPKEDEKTVS